MPSQIVHSDHNEAAVSRAAANSTVAGKAIQAKKLSVNLPVSNIPVQKAPLPEEEKPVQGRFVNQLQGIDEEDLPVQGKFILQKAALPEEEEIVQGRFVHQLQGIDEEELPIQGRFILQKVALPEEEAIQQKAYVPTNNTGLPDNLKSGIENLSGFAMDDVKVHYNSDKPAQLNAHAYAQGTDIHIASGQEKHLPHEAWHVVQQKQGRVKPTMQMKGGIGVNDDVSLEKEADVMGGKASQFNNIQRDKIVQKKHGSQIQTYSQDAEKNIIQKTSEIAVVQMYTDADYEPNLTGLTVPGGGLDVYSVDTFNRPADWYEGTLDSLFAIRMQQGRVEILNIMGHSMAMVLCDVTDVPAHINDMDIGHVENWAEYVELKGPVNIREATNAYNDLNNLRLEKPTPNRSHDFESGRLSEEDDDSDSDLDDFIEKDDEMDPKARIALDAYKAGKPMDMI